MMIMMGFKERRFASTTPGRKLVGWALVQDGAFTPEETNTCFALNRMRAFASGQVRNFVLRHTGCPSLRWRSWPGRGGTSLH